MIDDSIKKYLSENSRIIIGSNYTDIIVKNDEDFLRTLYFCTRYKVVSILWWDYHLVNESSEHSLGYGGPIDPCNPIFMWSETLIEKTIPDEWGICEIEEYLRKTKELYLPRVLIPSFSIEIVG